MNIDRQQIWMSSKDYIIIALGIAIYAFGFCAVVILISTFSFFYTLYVLISMVSTIFLIMGILYFTGWKIGTNEAIMISISSGFCADFIIQPMLAISHDFSKRSLYGKIQASLTTFCTPVTSALITTLVAACFLYPCDILLFPPFATFLLGSGVFGIIHGFIVLPALVAIFSFNKRDKILKFHLPFSGITRCLLLFFYIEGTITSAKIEIELSRRTS